MIKMSYYVICIRSCDTVNSLYTEHHWDQICLIGIWNKQVKCKDLAH